MAHVIIGTAGHIDHGKTTLIRSLTGIETDRLKEEKQRGITIELGFAYFDLPDGRRAGIIDVPGHERFIRHMLAGVGGMDLVLLVVAADEGVMPQTVEHLDIVDLLGVEQGIIVVTKADLVDEEMVELVIEEVREQVKGTVLETAPAVAVSATTGQNLEALVRLIDERTRSLKSRNELAPVRLPIDRVFTVKGHGTIVTGTLLEGRLHVEDPVEIYPDRRSVKVRNIQIHGTSADAAVAGQRTAVNLSGVKREEIRRGDVIAAPGSLALTSIIDVRLRLLPGAHRDLRHGMRVRFYLGTREMLGRLILLDRDEIHPGDEVYAQLRFSEQLACKHGDRFVIRFYSPMETIGGGMIIDPMAAKHRRHDSEVIEEMALKEHGSLEDLIETFIRSEGDQAVELKRIAGQLGEGEQVLLESLDSLREQGLLLELEPRTYLHHEALERFAAQVLDLLQSFHQRSPLKRGIGREELRSRLFKGMKKSHFEAVLSALENQGLLVRFRDIVALHGFVVTLTPTQQASVERILGAFREDGSKPKTLVAVEEQVGKVEPDLLNWMIEEGSVVRLNHDILCEKDFYLYAKKVIIKHIESNGSLSVKDVRDLLDISRKFSVPLLEHLDEQRVTKRLDDVRILC